MATKAARPAWLVPVTVGIAIVAVTMIGIVVATSGGDDETAADPPTTTLEAPVVTTVAPATTIAATTTLAPTTTAAPTTTVAPTTTLAPTTTTIAPVVFDGVYAGNFTVTRADPRSGNDVGDVIPFTITVAGPCDGVGACQLTFERYSIVLDGAPLGNGSYAQTRRIESDGCIGMVIVDQFEYALTVVNGARTLSMSWLMSFDPREGRERGTGNPCSGNGLDQVYVATLP